MSQTEVTFYNNNGTIVTNKRLVLNGVTVATSQIATFTRTRTDETIPPPMSEEAKGAMGGGCLGIIFLVGGIIGLTNYTNNLMLAGSIGATAIGMFFLFLLLRYKPTTETPPPTIVTTHYFSIATSNTALPLHTYTTTDSTDADVFEQALNNAIMSQ
jgi:hypothetical protein